MNLTAPVNQQFSLRSALSFQRGLDRVGSNDSRTRSLNVGLSHTINWAGIRGRIAPGVSYRDTDASRGINYSLALQLAKGNHSLSANAGHDLNRPLSGTQIDASQLTLRYGYRRGPHQLSVEVAEHYRDPSEGRFSEGRQYALAWTYSAARRFGGVSAASSTTPGTGRPAAAGNELALASFAPGSALADIAAFQGLGATRNGDLLVSEVALLPIDQRQRLAVSQFRGVVDFSVLIIDFDDTGSPDSVEQTFERVAQQLSDRYGKPTSFFDRGDFGDDLVAAVNSDQFIRTLEWDLPGGRVRFGVPRRLDGLVRMEVHYAQTFAPPTETFWSLEELL